MEGTLEVIQINLPWQPRSLSTLPDWLFSSPVRSGEVNTSHHRSYWKPCTALRGDIPPNLHLQPLAPFLYAGEVIHTPYGICSSKFKGPCADHPQEDGNELRNLQVPVTVRRRRAQRRVRWTSANHRNRIFVKALTCSRCGRLEPGLPAAALGRAGWTWRAAGGAGDTAGEAVHRSRGSPSVAGACSAWTRSRRRQTARAGRARLPSQRPQVTPAHGREDSLLESGASLKKSP